MNYEGIDIIYRKYLKLLKKVLKEKYSEDIEFKVMNVFYEEYKQEIAYKIWIN